MDIYARISRDGEGAGLGVARQEKDCRAHLKALGYSVGEVLVDNDLSAYKGKARPAYTSLLDRIRAGESDGFAVWHLDRLTRHMRELEDVIDLVETTGALVLTVTGGAYDLTTTDGRAMARVVATFARKESEDKSRRIRRKHLEMAQDGRPVGGARHFGYEPLVTDGEPTLLDHEGYPTLKIRESEAALIREAVDAVLAGRSLYSVVKEWNDRGVSFGKGAKVTPGTLKHILGSPTITGWRGLKREFVTPGRWEPIISRDVQAEVMAILDDRSEAFAQFRGGRTYLLSGLVRCGRCGAKMVAQAHGRGRDSNRNRTYMCPYDPGRAGCGRMRVVAEPVEREVFDRLLSVIDATIPEPAPDDPSRPVRAELGDVEARMATLAEDYYVHRRIAASQFHRANASLVAREQELRAALATTAVARAAPSIRDAGHLQAAWDDLDVSEQRSVVGQFVEAVVIHPAQTRGKFDAERVEVLWR